MTTKEREEFIVLMHNEGMSLPAARTIMRNAATIQRCAELACSSEAADRDRIPCPGVKDEDRCLCDKYAHESIPRIALAEYRAQKRIEAACKPYGVNPDFSGDPRGACVKLKVPSGKTNDWGHEGICVPA